MFPLKYITIVRFGINSYLSTCKSGPEVTEAFEIPSNTVRGVYYGGPGVESTNKQNRKHNSNCAAVAIGN